MKGVIASSSKCKKFDSFLIGLEKERISVGFCDGEKEADRRGF
jgi:hypothetical protein